VIAPRHRCDTRSLQHLLDDRLNAPDCEQLIGHLESCPQCWQQLESMAGDPSIWKQATETLSMGPEVDEAEACNANDAARLTESIKRLLQPADDRDECLGLLDHYRILRVVGRGGMGVVLLARDPSLERFVAIKILHPYLASAAAARQRFGREAKAAAAIAHPHVVPIHAVSADRDPPYLVMRYVPGGSLQQRLDRVGALPLAETLRIGLQVAQGLAAAHAQGLAHRDIKPANVLLEAGSDLALITDFGLARAIDDATLTNSGTVTGTPAYMSPEQARGDLVDHRSDLFSFGGMLYAMATGRPPFRGTAPLSVLRNVCEQSPTPVHRIVESLPAWFDRLVMWLLEKRPEDRPDQASFVADLLQRALAHVQHPHAYALPRELLTRGDRRSIRVAATALGSIALAISVGFAAARWRPFANTPSEDASVAIQRSPTDADEVPAHGYFAPRSWMRWEDAFDRSAQQVAEEISALRGD
jgi:hypothetical protein